MQGESLIVRDLEIVATPDGGEERSIVSRIGFCARTRRGAA
ncbi:hypothetical protein [Salinicola tamaricis]|nr:hypothetical protein [Salinicola tamaricis]